MKTDYGLASEYGYLLFTQKTASQPVCAQIPTYLHTKKFMHEVLHEVAKKRENIFAHMTTNRQTRLAINGLIEDTEQFFEQTKKKPHERFVVCTFGSCWWSVYKYVRFHYRFIFQVGHSELPL